MHGFLIWDGRSQMQGNEMIDVMIVEDHEEIGSILADFLENEGYDTYLATTGEEAIAVFEDEGVKLFILDVMLPGMDGFAVCSRIRKSGNTPIIIVSAKDGKEDKLNGLMLGADDYIEKPYDIDILLAKVNGIFARRYASNEMVEGDIRIDKMARKAFYKEVEVSMTMKEYDLLNYLIENKGQVLKKEDLFNQIWGFDSDSEMQTLTVHIKWLREKFEENPKKPTHIQTVWGVGYRFE